MPLIYLAHPVSAPTLEGVAENVQRGKDWLLWCIRLMPPGYSFVAPWITMAEILDDSNPGDRTRGMEIDFDVLRRCDALWLVGGRVSHGMHSEVAFAEARDIKVLDLTSLGTNPSEAQDCPLCGICGSPAAWEIHPPEGSPLMSDLYCDGCVPPTPFGFRAERV